MTMKKISKSMAFALCAIFTTLIQAHAQWAFNGADIYNTTIVNGSTVNTNGNVGIGIKNSLLQRLHVN